MSILIYEGVIDHGQVRLRTELGLPDNTRVYVVIPDMAIEPEASVYDVHVGDPDQNRGAQTVHIYSPRIAPPGKASDLKLEIIEEASGANV